MKESAVTQLSIVIPVYNEVDNIVPLIDEIKAALKITHEIIFVDDGSNDGTREKLISVSAQDQSIRTITHPVNRGQSASIVTGVRAARYAWALTIDGDGQNDPADIPLLSATLDRHIMQQQQSAIIIGNRTKRADPWTKRVSSRIANAVRRRLLNDDCSDTNCSLKLFARDAFLQLPHFNHLHRFLPALFKRAGLTVINVPVNHRPRKHGKSKYGINNRLWTGMYDLLGVRWLLKRPCKVEVEHEQH